MRSVGPLYGVARSARVLLALLVLSMLLPVIGVSAAADPRTDPRLGQAVVWATRELVSSQRWIEDGDTLCDKFAEAAFGVTDQYPTAYDMYKAIGSGGDVARHTLAGLRDAPPGSLVFFAPNKANGDAGHVGIYLGNDAFIGVVTAGGVRVHGVGWWNDHIATFLGWAYPQTKWPGSGMSGYTAQKVVAATTAFDTRHRAGEAITAGFWGTAMIVPRPEPYSNAPDKVRLVQYFDKGRMESGADGTVTNGLLATEMIKGKIQVGDNAYQAKPPPGVPIAGDPSNPGPTYAQIATKGASLLKAASRRIGSPVNSAVSSAGEVSTAKAGSDSALVIAAFDDATKHNVPQAFADFRDKVGLGTLGYAISEPFLAQVKVSGKSKQVMAQVFERRVLTYTADNPAAYKVEFANVGQHYYHWRYDQ